MTIKTLTTKSIILNLLAYFIIPVYTLMFVHGSNWFTTNFSVLGNALQRREGFVIWGLLVGFYDLYCLKSTVRAMTKKPAATGFIPLSFWLLMLAIVTPYLPELFPFKAFLHVIFAFFAAVCLVMALTFIIVCLYRQNPKSIRPYLLFLVLIVIISAWLLYLVGIVSSVLEIFFTLSTVILLRLLLHTLTSPRSM